MVTRTRHRFRPSLDGVRLEERVALSTAAEAIPAQVVTAEAVDPLVHPPNLTFKNSYIQATLNQLHASFKSFLNKYTNALQNAAVGLGNGKNQADLLAGVKAYTALEGGILQTQLDRVSKRLPGGEMYLYNPPQGTVPGGYPPVGSTTCGPDLRYYVRPELRIKTQVSAMLAFLDTNATSIQQASSQAATLNILNTYQQSKAATLRYVSCGVKQQDFNILGYSPN